MPNLRTVMTKLGAVVCGLLTFAVTFIINVIGSLVLTHHLKLSPRWMQAEQNYPLVVGYEWVGQVFLYGYPAAVGVVTIFFLWRGIPKETFRIILYILILALVGPLTFINYQMNDQWLNLWIQLSFNLFVAFVGYVLVLKIRDVKPQAADLKAFQSLAVLLIAALLVALPLFYSAIFLAVALHLTDHKGVQAISEKIPMAVAGAAGIIAVLLNNMDSIRGAKAKAEGEKA